MLWPASPAGLPLKFPTIANTLKQAGYTTHIVGKWHLGFHKKEYLPINRGFDTFFGKHKLLPVVPRGYIFCIQVNVFYRCILM